MGAVITGTGPTGKEGAAGGLDDKARLWKQRGGSFMKFDVTSARNQTGVYSATLSGVSGVVLTRK